MRRGRLLGSPTAPPHTTYRPPPASDNLESLGKVVGPGEKEINTAGGVEKINTEYKRERQ